MQYTFFHELTRGDEDLEVEVTAEADSFNNVDILQVTESGEALEISDAEETTLVCRAYELLDEAIADAEADEGDYRYDLSREEDS